MSDDKMVLVPFCGEVECEKDISTKYSYKIPLTQDQKDQKVQNAKQNPSASHMNNPKKNHQLASTATNQHQATPTLANHSNKTYFIYKKNHTTIKPQHSYPHHP